MKKMIFLLSLFILLLSSSFLFSDTIIVDTTGTGDYTTIQEGIDAASDGDTVLVYTGTYYENINYNGKNITVSSLYLTTQNNSYIHSTIIDGNQNGSVVSIINGEDNAILCGFTIKNGSGTNWAYYYFVGGGVYIINSSLTIESCIICNNKSDYGAGIECQNAHINLICVTIRHNHAFAACGGIYFDNSSVDFSNTNRCNIYENYAGSGSDIGIAQSPPMDIIVDTFTVMEPSIDFILGYEESSSIEILNAKIEPVNQDLYVSPEGDNANSGLNSEEPLENISYALLKVASDSTHPNTIYLAEGIYSPSLTGEKFSLNCRNYVSLIGESEESTILDAENLSSLIKCIFGDSYFSIENLTLQNGNSRIGGGMYIYNNSNPIIKNVIIRDNFATSIGTHIYCHHNCNPIFENVKLKSPSTPVEAAAISLYNHCSPVFINCSIEDNNDTIHGTGAIYCNGNSNPILINTKIINNNAIGASGITVYNGSEGEEPILINCTICNNLHCDDGTIRQSFDTNLILINCILRNYPQNEIYFNAQGGPDTVTISYTNIEGGINAINTNNNGTIHWLEGNIDSLPQFVGGDPFSYQLQPSSPCVDAGTPDTTGLNLPATDLAGNPRIFNGRIDIGCYECQDTIGVDPPDTSFIHNLYLFQNTPNPFTSKTEILFITADYERVGDYSLSIYNSKGQLVRRFDGNNHDFWVKTKIVWDGTDEHGKQVALGAYFYKLEYNGNAVVRKMVKIR